MRPVLERFGVETFALSKDTVAEAQAHKLRDNLRLTLLSDVDMRVIEDYGLRHDKALEFRTWRVLGVPLGFPRRFKSMAIPTTLIIDEMCIVRFIDQADDYRMRGDEQRITRALSDVFGPHE